MTWKQHFDELYEEALAKAQGVAIDAVLSLEDIAELAKIALAKANGDPIHDE